ncbi:MAG: hypothetical protein QXK88_02935 [Desulfurococcaceae archaeon]
MACFITPLIAGAVVGFISKFWKKADKLKLYVLAYLLLGGSLVLAVEHAWHGEISPYPPFLTAMRTPEEMPVVLNEITNLGGSMTLAVVGLWLGILATSKKLEIKAKTATRISTTLELKA